MSTSPYQHATLADRLTRDRLGPYLRACGDDLAAAIELYDWNSQISGAAYEDVGRLEVIFRNSLDAALGELCQSQGWADAWYRPTRPVPRQTRTPAA